MAGGGTDNSARDMLDFEKQQVAKAEREERQRQARLARGTDHIDKIFGRIDNSFYDKYLNNYLAYYQPQVAEQYKTAKDNETFGFARAGTLKSSAAASEAAKLYQKKLDQDAMVRSQADAATGQLRNSVLESKNGAINQLYATEDPSLASSLATNSVKNLQGQQPKYDPLGELFQSLAVGAAGYINANSQRASSSGGYYGSAGSPSTVTKVG